MGVIKLFEHYVIHNIIKLIEFPKNGIFVHTAEGKLTGLSQNSVAMTILLALSKHISSRPLIK